MAQVSRWQFMAEINRRLREHAHYQPGMAFVAYPIGSPLRTASGYTGLPNNATHLLQRIAADANLEFDVSRDGVCGPRATKLTQFLDERNRADEKVPGAVLLGVADVFDEILCIGFMRPEHIATVVESFGHPAAIVHLNCYESVWWLQRHGFECGPLLMAAMASVRADVRYLALCCVTNETSDETSTAILSLGLSDKGSAVRVRAARQAQERGKPWMLPQVQAALEVEKNPKTRSTMASAVDSMRRQLARGSQPRDF